MTFGNSIAPLSGASSLYSSYSSERELKDLLTHLNDAIRRKSFFFVEKNRSRVLQQAQAVQSVLNRYEAYCKHYDSGRKKVLAELLTNDDSGLEEIYYSWKDLSSYQLGKDLDSLISQEPDGDYSLEDQKRLICQLCEFYLKSEEKYSRCLIYLLLQLEGNPYKAEICNALYTVIYSNFSEFINCALNHHSENENVLGSMLEALLEQMTPAFLEQCDSHVDSLSKVWNVEHVDKQLQEKFHHTVCERFFPDEKTLFRFARKHQSPLSFLFKMGMRAPESSFPGGEVDRWPKSFLKILTLNPEEIQYLRFLDYACHFSDSRYAFHHELIKHVRQIPFAPSWNKRDFHLILRSYFYLISNHVSNNDYSSSSFPSYFYDNETTLDFFQNEFVKMFQFASSSSSLNEMAISQMRLGINVEAHYQKTAERVRRFQLDLFDSSFTYQPAFEMQLLKRFMLVYSGVRNKEQVLCSLLVDVIKEIPKTTFNRLDVFVRTVLSHLAEKHQDVFGEFVGSVLYESDDFFKKLSLIAGYQESSLAKALFSRLCFFDRERSAFLKGALEDLHVGAFGSSSDESYSDSDSSDE